MNVTTHMWILFMGTELHGSRPLCWHSGDPSTSR